MIYLRLFWEFFKTGLFAVGGGMATLPFLKNIGLSTGWYSQTALMNMLAVSESTPGPIGIIELPVCVGYEIDGEVTRDFPTTSKLKKAKPVYEVLPGWKCDIRGITEYDKLPENCRKYIEFIEKELEVPVKMVSNGPGRHEIIHR